MKKLFAYAAIAVAGAFVLATHSNAKPGGFAGGGFKGKPFVFAKPHIAKFKFAGHPHHFAHLHDFAHHHRFAHRHRFEFPGLFAWGAPYYAEPQIVEVPQESDDVTGSTEPRRVSVWRGPDSSGACSVQSVTVPASQGGETTVRIIRC